MWKVGGALDAPAPVAVGAHRRLRPRRSRNRPTPWSRSRSCCRWVAPAPRPARASWPRRTPATAPTTTWTATSSRSSTGRRSPPSTATSVVPAGAPTARSILDAESQDLTGFEPYYVQPVIDEAANEQSTDPVGDAVFPATLARVANPVAADGSAFQLPGGGCRTVPAQRRGRRHRRAAPLHPPGHRGDLRRRVGDGLRSSVHRAQRGIRRGEHGRILRPGLHRHRSGSTCCTRSPTADAGNWEGVDLVRTGTDPVDGSALWTGGAVLPGPPT